MQDSEQRYVGVTQSSSTKRTVDGVPVEWRGGSLEFCMSNGPGCMDWTDSELLAPGWAGEALAHTSHNWWSVLAVQEGRRAPSWPKRLWASMRHVHCLYFHGLLHGRCCAVCMPRIIKFYIVFRGCEEHADERPVLEWIMIPPDSISIWHICI